MTLQDQHLTRPRAAAVVIVDGRLLVVTRVKDGRTYAVLPGGGIEEGEAASVAAVRELAEECSLQAVAETPSVSTQHLRAHLRDLLAS